MWILHLYLLALAKRKMQFSSSSSSSSSAFLNNHNHNPPDRLTPQTHNSPFRLLRPRFSPYPHDWIKKAIGVEGQCQRLRLFYYRRALFTARLTLHIHSAQRRVYISRSAQRQRQRQRIDLAASISIVASSSRYRQTAFYARDGVSQPPTSSATSTDY